VLSAYVLIQTEVGAAVRVARAVSELDGVERAEDVTGPYDVIARIQARGLDQLGGWWSPASRPWTASPAP
jgi:DNA-binding Lrp family transcriptional regulator